MLTTSATTLHSVVQQSNSINGTIVDELGEPMIGVTIKKKGSGVGDEARCGE